MFVDPSVGDRPQVRDLGISTVSDSGFTTRRRSSVEMSSANISAMRVPVAGREVRREALDRLGLPRFPAAAPAG